MNKDIKPVIESSESSIPTPEESILQYQNIHRIVSNAARKSNRIHQVPVSAREKILRRKCTDNFKETKPQCNFTGEQILNMIIEPRVTTIGKELFVQDVSSCPGKTLDVVYLQERLNQELKLKGAKSTGICSIRRKLYEEVFREIIRQVTIECMERGLLLSRVNSELNLSLVKLRQIYESEIAYGMNKTLRAQRRRVNYFNSVETLTQEIENLKIELSEASAKVDATQEKEEQRFLALKKKFEIDITFMKKNYDQLKQQLVESIELVKHPQTG